MTRQEAMQNPLKVIEDNGLMLSHNGNGKWFLQMFSQDTSRAKGWCVSVSKAYEGDSPEQCLDKYLKEYWGV
jgi:hypothetical protein